MSKLVHFQRHVIGLLFRRDFEGHLSELLGKADARAERDEKRWRVYRRMARTRLADCLDHSFPRLSALLGDDWRPFVERWLDEAPPKSPYLRDVAGELAAWVGTIERPKGAPEWITELAALEWALLDTEYSSEEEGAGRAEAGDLSMELPAVLSPAHRMLSLQWSVHRLPHDASDRSLVVKAPVTLCIYRDPASHDSRVLELTPVAASILAEIARREQPLVDVVRAVAAREGVAIDAAFLEQLSDLIADLMERGLWLGSRAASS